MKRMLILTALAMIAMSSTGCGTLRNWWNRGDACEVCDSDFVYNEVYDDGVVVAPPSMMPVFPDGTLEALPTPQGR